MGPNLAPCLTQSWLDFGLQKNVTRKFDNNKGKMGVGGDEEVRYAARITSNEECHEICGNKTAFLIPTNLSI